MNMLLVGALSWNPERIRSLHERGHRMWGLWSRSMAWDQGPYPSLQDCVTPVTLADAARTIREHSIDCVYSLFQVYHRSLWGPSAPGIEHDIWTLLRSLLDERRRGVFDVPLIRHWGFDVHHLAPDVARELDAHVFCNREKLAYWNTPVRAGGCGVDAFENCAVTAFLDGDRPKLEFMNDDFTEPLSTRSGEIHTVCIGRPFGIDYLAAARREIHVHHYGNSHDDVWRMIVRELPLSGARREAALLRRFVHVHPSLQTTGMGWEDVRRAKSSWVREFSRYDAGWSYIGSPLPWEPLDDRGAIPNRVSTYVLAGLPVISDVRPGYYRYDELTRLGINLDFTGFDDLRERLDLEVCNRQGRRNALRERAGYSFDAMLDPLIATLERSCEDYATRSHSDRVQARGGRHRLIHFNTSPDPRAVAIGWMRQVARPAQGPNGATGKRLAPLLVAIRAQLRQRFENVRASLLARWLKPVLGRADTNGSPAASADKHARKRR